MELMKRVLIVQIKDEWHEVNEKILSEIKVLKLMNTDRNPSRRQTYHNMEPFCG